MVAGTFFAAPCPKVGAGFQPAHAIPQVENLRPLQATCGHFGRSKKATSGGTLVDAARGQALASRSSYHRVFRSRGRFEPGPGFVRGQVYPDLVAVTFFVL